MSPMLTDDARSRVTATLQRFRGIFTRPALPRRALSVLDLADRANATVYEDEDYRSYAVDGRGVVEDVTREVNRLLAYGPKGVPLIVAGHWTSQGKRTVRRWQVTAHGQLVLTAAGRIRRPAAISAGVKS